MKKITTIIVIIIISLILLVINVNINTNAKIIITDKNNEEIAYLNNKHITNKTDISIINPKHLDFLIYIEDKDFYHHKGFNVKRIISSIYYNITHKDTIGASTITQQYIKNTYLNNNKSIFRKIKEILLSVNLETKLTKDEILSEYLSSIYFGNNVYGITNASKYYYNKKLSELTDKEFLSLIALWNSPSVFSKNIEKWNYKKNLYAKKLLKGKLIDTDKYKELITPIELSINKKYLPSNRLFYIDQVMHEFNQMGISSGFNKEIIINTDYDNRLEDIEIQSDSNYSLLAYNKDGRIISCIGNSNYYNNTYNIAINGKRDIGSTIKPLLYYEAIKCGFKNQKYVSEEFTYKYNDEEITITNKNDAYYGNINMKQAIAVSCNIYAIKTHLALGMNTLAIHLKKYNINASPIPSLALGSIGLSLKELCDIYTQFFNKGLYSKGNFIKTIFTKNILTQNNVKSKKINDPLICEQINELLKGPFSKEIKNATCSSITNALPVECRGKTGSTNYDSYLIGYSDDYLIGVWSGYIEGDKLISKTASSIPKALFTKAMNRLY